MSTPMRRQYLAIKKQHPNAILFFRLGDFYETFDEDAKIVARVCDVVLTSRPVGANLRVPLAGVPYHSVDGYVAKLVEAGYRVAIAEQVSEPGKGLVEREVVQVVSRGTVTEPHMLDEKRNNYLVAVTLNRSGQSAGVAYCDVSTGEFAAAQMDGPSPHLLLQQIGEELSRLRPSELITGDWQLAGSELAPLVQSLGCLVSTVEPWQVELDTATDFLHRHFRVGSLDGFGLRGRPEAVRAVAAVLAYLQEMQPAALEQLRTVHSYTTAEFMVLDESTRRNLELTETIRGGGSRGSLLEVLDDTRTPMGGRLLRRWLGQPLLGVDAVNRRLDAVAFLVGETALRLELREALQGLGDLERWSNRILQGKGLPRDLVGVREVLRRVPQIRAPFQALPEGADPGREPLPEMLASQLPSCDSLRELLENAVPEEPPATLANPGLIREGYDPDLDEIIHKSRHAKEWVAQLQNRERDRLDIKSLKVGYNKVFGYYIEVTHTHRDKVPAEYIRKQTLTNAERYITPDLKEYESLILNADERRLDLEQQIFRDLCRAVTEEMSHLQELAAALARLDLFAALAEVAVHRRYVRPQVDDGPAILIYGGRHPVVELTQKETPFVPNDLELTPESAIQILTGPNMAGKSTYLRQAALITLMAQIGSYVPAEQAQIGVVDRIFTRIGASDEIHRGQSTFMVEMVETANILNHATRRSLLVLDEIGRGTSTYDGLAIAWAVIEFIHNHPQLRAKTLFATHYHELTDLAERLPHVVNANVAVDDSGEEVVFLHRIVPGRAERSFGVHVGRMAGLPLAVVHRAEEILAELEASGAAGPRRLTDRGGGGRPAGPMQVSLFAEIHPVITALRQLDINSLTPLDALNRLFELHQLARE